MEFPFLLEIKNKYSNLYVKDIAPSVMIETRSSGALKFASEAHDKNVPAKRADFFKKVLL